MNESVLWTAGLGKRYRSAWALRDCDLDLPTGRVIALVGPNGAGKTTLLRIIAGLLRPTVGELHVLGAPADGSSPATLAEIGFVAQEHPLYRRFRVRELLRMGDELNLRWDQGFAEDRLRRLGIPLEQRAGALSGGQRAQVALTLALAKRPRLLILDEPVASLDPLARQAFMQTLMGSVAEHDVTVLLSSHVLAELERVCDYLILLAAGHVQVAGEIDGLLATHRLLSGPPGALVDSMPGVIHVTTGDRRSDAVVRTDDGVDLLGWESHPVGLEELALAYLRRAASPGSEIQELVS
ncbi:ABC transporter related [Beutenbergia cavernae DSM 12333]|uniref:ABC transporter related n=1 Tax=Beutenbergia cavernae (strain ATCC BAA-8 / DSM 12333 / CCUG 43141 / JCM 11478 / NBRC 16432 / NCIMB 13614 / HKI 0122) TaxID=471853 RepID=C5C057_BEUC1|nr:ABC transporter ATP-binding protein [Beutenbergia cavernae]ACQ79243.1 ABC transporter related [Beutenbergia cavernae DSM 12333]